MSVSYPDITAKNEYLSDVLKDKKYKVDYYQRDYAWGEKEVTELLEDLIIKFNESYNHGDTPQKTKNYKQYFLGTFVINDKDTDNYIIDGQQRLTTLTLLFSYIYTYGKKTNNSSLEKSIDYVYSETLDEKTFNIDVKERNEIMEYIVNINDDNDNIPDYVTNHILMKNFKIIESFFDNITISDDKFKVFYHWLYSKVFMVKITTYDSKEAYTIFESMNDRGKSLTNLDMFKGYLLSLIDDDQNNRKEALDRWSHISDKFKSDKIFSNFVIELFRAKYSNTTYKSNSSLITDWTRIGQEFHRFFKEHRKEPRIGINNSGDAQKFLKELDYYADYYLKLQNRKAVLTPEYEHLYYLNKTRHASLDTLFLGVINPHDPHESLKTKIVGEFLDIRSGYFAWNNMDLVNESNFSNYIILLLKRIRAFEDDPMVLIDLFNKELSKYSPETSKNLSWKPISNDRPLSLNGGGTSKRNIFYILARVSALVEGKDKAFVDFYEEKHDIEHILAKDYQVNKEYFTSEDIFESVRNNIGALGLLEGRINSSLKDDPYCTKKTKYLECNNFLATVNKEIYKDNGSFLNNPHLNKLVQNNPQLKGLFKPYSEFNESAIKDRNLLISELAKIVWNKNKFLKFTQGYSLEEISEIVSLEYSTIEEDYKDTNPHRISYTIGQEIIIENDDSYAIVTYDGNKRVTLRKLHNAIPLNYKTQKIENELDEVSKKVMSECTINATKTFNWEGTIADLTLRTPIFMLIGKNSLNDKTRVSKLYPNIYG